MDFTEFYLYGGNFMHLITLTAIASAVHVVKGVAAKRRGEAVVHRLVLVRGFNTAAILLGVLGTLFGAMDIAAALQTVDPGLWAQAGVRGARIAIIPLIFSVMVFLPLHMCGVALQYSAKARELKSR